MPTRTVTKTLEDGSTVTFKERFRSKPIALILIVLMTPIGLFYMNRKAEGVLWFVAVLSLVIALGVNIFKLAILQILVIVFLLGYVGSMSKERFHTFVNPKL